MRMLKRWSQQLHSEDAEEVEATGGGNSYMVRMLKRWSQQLHGEEAEEVEPKATW